MSGFRRVCVVGMGYIGLPTSVVFAKAGLEVVGVDTNPEVVTWINSGKAHIVEPHLDEMLREVVEQGRLRAVATPDIADAFILAVPTPFQGDHKPDLRFVRAATQSIAPYLRHGNLVILESTSPVGTTDNISKWLAEARPELTFPHQAGEASDIRIAHCPERVLPGQILHEVVHNNRVIGGITQECGRAAAALYKVFVKGVCHLTSARTAEMAKLAENSFRDVNIAFANELSLICDELKIDVWELIRIANLHPRVNILQPGPGVGGHCIAVDPWFIVDSAPESAKLIRTARIVNDAKPNFVLEKVHAALGKFDRPVLACLGLAFKANVDDLRESPALEITRHLAEERRWTTLVVEPNIDELPPPLDGKVHLVDLDTALSKADVLLLLVDHKVFVDVDRSRLKGKTIIDTRGVWSR